jgi:hypothetical protein
MAKMKLSPTADELTGKLGNMVHRQLWGRHVVSRVPDFSRRVLTPKQLGENNKYKWAGLIWKGLSAETRAAYKDWGRQLNKPPYALFNLNYASPPVVENIDLSKYSGQPGQTINIRAVDLFEVARVEVTVRQVDGELVERGLAIRSQADPRQWNYQTTVVVPTPANLVIEAVAVNWPSKQASRPAVISLPGT